MRSNGIYRGCVIQQNQPKDVKPRRERKVRKDVYWQGDVKAKKA